MGKTVVENYLNDATLFTSHYPPKFILTYYIILYFFLFFGGETQVVN